MTRRFAQDTTVPIAKSRGEIDSLLRAWGCGQIQWSDDYERGRVRLQFVWQRQERAYLARFDLQLPSDADLRSRAKDGRSQKFSEPKYRKLMEGNGRREHRALALFIKAALNAVEDGIISPEQVFLPYLVGRDGRTLAEAAIPRLPQLLAGGDVHLLLGPGA